MNDDALERRVAGMRRSVTPSEGTWEKIEARIVGAGREADRPTGRAVDRRPHRVVPRHGARRPLRLGAPVWAGLAAAACLAAAAAVVAPRLIVPADAGAADLAALRRELRDAEREYAAARNRLLASLRAIADAAGPAAVADLENELRSLDRIVADYRAGVGAAAEPDDWQTEYRLVRLYRSQTAGVARADELVRSVSYREVSQ